jgi:hypothetical protein
MPNLGDFSAALLVGVTIAIVAASREMKMGRSKLNIDEYGAIAFHRQVGNDSDNAYSLKILLDQLMQVDNDGNTLTDCEEPTNSSKPGMGWVKHQRKAAMKEKMKSFKGFGSQKVRFENKKLRQKMAHGSMKADKQTFRRLLGDGMGEMAIVVSLPEEDGYIDIDGEKQRLKKGDMKFNIEMSEWNWCDNAAFLDVYVKVSGKHAPRKRFGRSNTRPASYYMGDNATVSFSGKYQNETGTWVDMPGGFPKIDSFDASRIIVRFPLFEDKIVYDPTVSEGDDDDDDTSDGRRFGVSAILVLLTTITVTVYVVLT